MRRPGPDWISPYDLPNGPKRHTYGNDELWGVETKWFLVDKQDGWWVVATAGGGSPDYYVGAEAFSVRLLDGVMETVRVETSMDRFRKIKHPQIDRIARDLMCRVRAFFQQHHCDALNKVET